MSTGVNIRATNHSISIVNVHCNLNITVCIVNKSLYAFFVLPQIVK